MQSLSLKSIALQETWKQEAPATANAQGSLSAGLGPANSRHISNPVEIRSATLRIPRYCSWHEVVMRNVYLILDRIHFPLVEFALNMDPLDPFARPLLVTVLLNAIVPTCVLQNNY